jgi:hypothetical protein
MSNRIETYKHLEKQYIRKSKGKQKERVKDLLNMYKDGRIFSKVTIQRELNRYLGHFKNEDQRDLHYFNTMAKYVTNSRKLENTQKKIEKQFEKVENVRLKRLVKSEDELPDEKSFDYSTNSA